MKIYTGSGDKGITSLFSGERVPKNHIRIKANGDIDELNAVLGGLVAALREEHLEISEDLKKTQSHLLEMGAWIATAGGLSSPAPMNTLTGESIIMLEAAIDQMGNQLPALTGFLIPGGHIVAAGAHIARTVCRRAERQVVRLLEEPVEGIAEEQLQKTIIYLNRLSDYLFVLARYLNASMNLPDILWQK
jgi:cob(I)alamin adenosyltransferase